MSGKTGTVNGGTKKRNTETPPAARHDEIQEKKRAGNKENHGDEEGAKNPGQSPPLGIATKKKGIGKENDSKGTPTSAPGNGKPVGIAEERGRADDEELGTAGEIQRDPLRELGSEGNGKKVDVKESDRELQGIVGGGTSSSKKPGGKEGQVSGTERKERGLEGISEEKVRETRLERLRHSDFRRYWQKGGRGPNPNRADPEVPRKDQDSGGKEDGLPKLGGAEEEEREVQKEPSAEEAARSAGSHAEPHGATAAVGTSPEETHESNERKGAGSNKINWGDRDDEDDDADLSEGGIEGKNKKFKGKIVIDATGDEEVVVITDEPEGFKLDGAAVGEAKIGRSVPPAPAQVHHGRGREDFRVDHDETRAVQTIKVRFEKILEHQTKQIDVPSLFKHTAHRFFQADPELVLLPIDDTGEDQRVLRQTVHIPPGKMDLESHFKYHTSQRKIEGIFKIQTALTIQELKNDHQIYKFLQENRIYCRQTEFSSAQCATIGWLFGSHPFYSRWDDTKMELRKRMPQLKKNEIFNVIPGKGRETMIDRHTKQEKVVVQESLRIEVPVECADVVREQFYTAFSQSNVGEFPVTGHMQFVPRRISKTMTRENLCAWACKQNQWCTSLEHYTLRGINNIDTEVRARDGRLTTLRKELLRTQDASGNRPLKMVERASFNRVYLVYERYNRDVVAQLGYGLDDLLDKVFDTSSIEVFREQTETDYTGESGPSTATSKAFEERMQERLGGAQQLNLTTPPPRSVQPHTREIEGTKFHPSDKPSGAPTGKSYKEAAERSAPADVLVYTASALQAERDQHIEVAAEQAKSEVMELAKENLHKMEEQEKKSQEAHQKKLEDHKETIDNQMELATAHLRKMRKANTQTEDNIKAQSVDINNMSVSLTETLVAVSGLSRSVQGLERNAGHMSAAMNNLSQNVALIQQALASTGMMASPASPQFVQMPPRPAKFTPVPALISPTQLTWAYDEGSETDSLSGPETNGEHLEESTPAPDASGGGTAD